MKIKIGIGIDNIIFGMFQEDVKAIWGNPDRVSLTEKDSGIVYSYNDRMVKLKFDEEEELKLYTIETFNPDTIMFNQKIIGKKKDEIRSILKDNRYKEPKYEEYDFFETLFCEEVRSTFEFEFDKLRSIEFSPLFNNDDELIWPKKI